MSDQSVRNGGEATSQVAISLVSLFWIFLKIGSTAFGGFMALISVVENMVVKRRNYLKHEDMLDGISLASMLPGPVAVNVVAFVGYRLRGGPGALVSAFAVILPSFVLIVGLTIAYLQWGQVPAVDRMFMGFIPAVTAIIVSTAWGMSRKTISGWLEVIILLTAAALLLMVGGFYITLVIIIGSGVCGWLLFHHLDGGRSATIAEPPSQPTKRNRVRTLMSATPAAPVMAMLLGTAGGGVLVKLFITFAGMSLMLFGGGYVFIPLIQEIVVDGHGWVTQQQFVDAIAMGQITPGPILISAAFIGYKVAGLLGALVATVGIFMPPILLMLISAKALDVIRRSDAIKAALRGVRPAVIGMIFAAALVVGRTGVLEGDAIWITGAIFVAALVVLMRFRIDVVWIIPAAGLSGLVLY